MKKISLLLLLVSLLFIGAESTPATPPEQALLFYLSGDHEFVADYAAGDPNPTFLRDVQVIKDGARGAGFECANTQLMAYSAPGNIYAERGSLAFSWRSRYPVGPTPFPIFRVGYADHSSWDMVWLRIDYNGRGGFDAFVTDINLSRIRISYVSPRFPRPNEWVHLSLSWDETRGIRFYVNGQLAAKQDRQAVLYAGLDQFGPHSRIISPFQVQSAYNFIRGGDIDEIRIYDRMLADPDVALIASGKSTGETAPLVRDLVKPEWRDEWWLRYGWNRKGDPPPYLSSSETSVHKVEIYDVHDLKRWWWKATDGIRETTWPGVYNRSRLSGRNDYFQLPDWDCYSLSGKAVTFSMPDEEWNQLEISGSASGKMLLTGEKEKLLFQRQPDQEKTVHRFSTPMTGQKIRFENAQQEEPIGELSAYKVSEGSEPKGSLKLAYTIRTSSDSKSNSLESLRRFIVGRETFDQRTMMTAVKEGDQIVNSIEVHPVSRLPLVHVLIPAEDWQTIADGLDGIAIDLPALRVKPTHGEYFPMNIQVRDPLWPQRSLLDVSFSVKPGEARTLWLDTRDRILPPGKALYVRIAGAGGDFGPGALEGTKLRLVFKPRDVAIKEHEIDRFTQARDSFAMMVEERPNDPRFNLYNRFAADINDVLRVNPNNWLAQTYWYDVDRRNPKPEFSQPLPPPDVPLWAFRQVEQLRNLKKFVLWYIDHRQIENGEFGGGLSDDGDLTNIWPATALMGVEPEKIRGSLLREMDAFYAQGMFTKGFPTIQTDDLHSYEEGISTLGQSLILDYADPKQLERAMETARSLKALTGINSAGHRHIRSSYFSGSKMAEEEPWGWSRSNSYLITHPALLLVEYNGCPEMKKLIVELADGLLGHRRKDANGRYRVFGTVKYKTDEDNVIPLDRVWPIFWASWRWTGDRKYLQPLIDEGPRTLEMITSNVLDQMGARQDVLNAVGRPSVGIEQGSDAAKYLGWQVTGEKKLLEDLYGSQIETSRLREYINTEGSLWIDRVNVPSSELQRARLGGVALIRNAYYPGHNVSWTFQSPSNEESVAILIPNATTRSMKVIAYNLTQSPVTATLTGWDVEPGRWQISQGIDQNRDDEIDGVVQKSTFEFERTLGVSVTFLPHVTTVLNLTLLDKGTAYWARSDLGIGKDDVVVKGQTMTVTVHSLGSVDSPPVELTLVDQAGKAVIHVMVPAITAPLDLIPKTVSVTLKVPEGFDVRSGSLVLDPDSRLKEITRMNNIVQLAGQHSVAGPSGK